MADEQKKKVAHGAPTKEFFITMITRDITLQDSIFDLLDNSLDGANREIFRRAPPPPEGKRYDGFWAELSFDAAHFKIMDNCGGIPLNDAIDYAFHFGRREDAPPNASHGIGLYGIGMKRAVLKMGKDVTVESFTKEEAFVVSINVDEWAKKKDDWDFDLDSIPKRDPGTVITIRRLNEGVGTEFGQRVFLNSLIKGIARDYSFFLQKGFVINVCGQAVEPFPFGLKESDQFEPIRIQYTDDTGVEVTIFAGLAGSPPDDTSPEVRLPDVDYWGWFVLCNDRVVLAGDKSEHTIWGDGEFPSWHPQYNGFMGIVLFRSEDPSKLPWTTTKREIEQTSALYRRAVAKMKEATRPYLDYTNERKEDLEKARHLEQAAVRKPVNQLVARQWMKVPTFAVSAKTKQVTIAYQKPPEKVARAKHALGAINMSNKALGEETFDYFYKNEAEQ